MSVYDNPDYYLARGLPEEAAWHKGMLRYGDQLAALAYARGHCNFDVFRKACGFEGDGSKPEPARTFEEQLALLDGFGTPRPLGGVLTIGEGRGELAYAVAQLGAYRVQALEPSKAAPALFELTCEKFGFDSYAVELLNYPLVPFPDQRHHRTVLVVEAIEHIPEMYWWAYFEGLNECRLVITNWIGAHPLKVGESWDTHGEHIFEINDAVYDRMSESGTVVYRRGSHFVLDIP